MEIAQTNNRHPWPLKKTKIWGPFDVYQSVIINLFQSYQLNSTANSAHLPIFPVNRQNWQCCLADSSKTVPRIYIFSMAMVAMVPQFIGHNKSFLHSVQCLILFLSLFSLMFIDASYQISHVFIQN
jgi:hypothetical protein